MQHVIIRHIADKNAEDWGTEAVNGLFINRIPKNKNLANRLAEEGGKTGYYTIAGAGEAGRKDSRRRETGKAAGDRKTDGKEADLKTEEV